MLKQRVLTALALIPLVVAAVWWLPAAGIAVLVGGLLLVGVAEWCRFGGLDGGAKWCCIGVMAAAMLALAPDWGWSAASQGVLMLGVAVWTAMAAWLGAYPRGFAGGRGLTVQILLIGGLLILPAYVALWTLHDAPRGRELFLILLALVWATDTGGYFAGKRFGRHKMSPQISPNKTWEGLAGGVLLAVAIAVFAARVVLDLQGAAVWRFAALGLAVSLISVVGDLSVSMFKRKTGVKDTGDLFPGHGGVLDRVDSLLAAAPVLTVGWLAGLV